MNNQDYNSLLANHLQSIMNVFIEQQNELNSIINQQNETIEKLTKRNLILEDENKKYKALADKFQFIEAQSESPNNETNIYDSMIFDSKLHQYNNTSYPIKKIKPFISMYQNSSKNKNTIKNINRTYNESANTISALNNSHISNTFISDRNNFLLNTSSQSHISNKTDISKYEQIRQKISNMRKVEYLNSDNSNNFVNDTPRNEHDNSKNESIKKKSSQFQNTLKFLNECKHYLNANKYEELIMLLKNGKSENTEKDIKKKVYEILEGNSRLKKMYNSI